MATKQTNAKPLKKRKFGKDSGRQWAYLTMLAPFTLAFTVFIVVPIISSIVLSFTNFNMVQMPSFVGFDNYWRIFTDDEVFMIALKNTLILAIVVGPCGYILSFVVAWFINELGRTARTVITFMVYSPSLAGNIYFIWLYIFSSDRRGFLNNLLLQLGILRDPITWLTDAKYNFTAVIIVSLWMSFGVGFLSFISALQALDRSYYEAAALDGLKNRWQELYYVTFPQIGPQLMFGAVTTIAGAFGTGAVSASLTGNPSTQYSTHTIILHMTDYGTTRYEMGYASALAVVLFAMMIATWLLVSKALKRFVE